MMNRVLAAIGVVLLIVGISVGGWLGGWWLNGANTDRQAHIDRQNYGSQLTYIDKVSSNITDIAAIDVQMTNPTMGAEQKAGLAAQKVAMVTSTCRIAHLIVDLPSDEGMWTQVHC